MDVPSSAPQIRSRITVVCAECKRLKLKCDRRTPCGSCTKRDTVMRCIYSPAAAEKVDLHSLNNRLIQVEGLLTLMTAGKTPPPFQSSYPLAQIPLPTPQVTYRQSQPKPGRPQITPGTASSTISISMSDLNSIWMVHCNLDVDNKVTQILESALDNNYIKPEPSLMDTILIHPPSSVHVNLPPLSIYYPPSQPSKYNYNTVTPFPDFTTSYTYSAQSDFSTNTPLLPPPPQSTSSPSASSVSISHSNTSISPSPSHAHLRPPSKKPHPTPSLLALLPVPPIRTKLLHRARIVYPELAVFIPWDRILDLSADQEELLEREKGREREKEKEKKTQLAKAVFYGVREESSSQSQAAPQETKPTFPLFVVLCYLLALGARNEVGAFEDGIDGTFLYALAGQATDVWETYRPSQCEYTQDYHHGQDHDQMGGQEQGYGSGLEDEDTNTTDSESEVEDVDFVLACLMQVVYLVRGAKNAGAGMKLVFPLMGKLVNMARNSGLARDPDIPDKFVDGKKGLSVQAGSAAVGVKDIGREKEKDRRRMLWWEIMFYDTFVADVLNQPATVVLSSYSTRWPACAYPSSSSSSSRKASSSQTPHIHQSHVHDGDADVDADVEDGIRQGDLNYNHPGRTPKRNSISPNASSGLKPREKGRGKTFASGVKPQEGGDSLPEVMFGVRCRLTLLTQTIKHHLTHPGSGSEPGSGCECECGYTLDQAVRLEAEIRLWVADLPPYLRLDAPPDLADTDVDPEMLMLLGVASAKAAVHRPSHRSPSTAILAAELAILANRLIMAVYVPFLRPSRSSATAGVHLHRAYVAHSWSPASRATVDAARGVVRAAMVMHRLMVGVGAASVDVDRNESGMWDGMVLSEFYSLEKTLVDAVVVCTHAGVVGGGVKVQKGKGVLEDAGAGLEVLAAMGVGRRRGGLARLVDALGRKVEGMGVNLGLGGTGVEENLLKRKHDQVEVAVDGSREDMEPISSAEGMFFEHESQGSQTFGSRSMEDTVLPHQPLCRSPLGTDTPSREREREREKEREKEKEKEKKHVRKGHATYPAVGYRVRDGKAAPPWATKHRTGSRSSPSADALRGSTVADQEMNYQSALSTPQHHHQPLPQIAQEQTYRSRSSSMSRMHPAMDFSMTFATQPQPSTTQTTQNSTQVFTLSPPSYNPTVAQQTQSQTQTQTQPSRSGSFESHRGYEPALTNQAGDSSAYGSTSVGSPYSSGSMSNASSPPYTSNVNVNGTGNTGASPFSSQPSNVSASPQAYFHGPQGYDNTSGGGGYEGQQRQQQGMMSMETAMVESSVSASAPIYDVKSSLDVQQQHMQRHMPYQDAHAHPPQMVSAAPGHAWSTAAGQPLPRQSQSQSIEQSHNGGGQYWGPSGVSIFY